MSASSIFSLPAVAAIVFAATGLLPASELPESPLPNTEVSGESPLEQKTFSVPETDSGERHVSPDGSKLDSVGPDSQVMAEAPLLAVPGVALSAGFTIAPNSTSPGGTVQISGSCGESSSPPDSINADFSHQTLTNDTDGETYFSFDLPVGSDGYVAHSIHIPLTASAGEYTVRYSCFYDDTGMKIPGANFTILGSETPPPTEAPRSTAQPTPAQKPEELAKTGNQPRQTGTILATVLALAGSLLLTRAAALRKRAHV
ncbi:hypothetical protein G7068_07610 [Leucobacter viscericola]|uniref:Uncharacterized protein n=1 Tax=Leucobacter viscericola TaxID=2714935 RepID=A0A6G7XF58_9MICO|nr:hypothetical protein [Leucobacter viscericola]QIK63079.1 hypothetical protein G7068_07610 [Leucobacter viscericola]